VFPIRTGHNDTPGIAFLVQRVKVGLQGIGNMPGNFYGAALQDKIKVMDRAAQQGIPHGASDQVYCQAIRENAADGFQYFGQNQRRRGRHIYNFRRFLEAGLRGAAGLLGCASLGNHPAA
jgi:hypothetical protein